MLNYFTKRNRNRANAETLYRAIVARARHRDLYAEIGVADTFDGRYELLMLHAIVVIRALGAAGEHGLAQEVFDLLFADMDQALRETGVSDIAVAKRIRPMAEAFYGRAEAYGRALAADAAPDALIGVIARNAFPDGEPPGGAARLGDYMLRLRDALGRADAADIVAAQVEWPDPVRPEPVRQ